MALSILCFKLACANNWTSLKVEKVTSGSGFDINHICHITNKTYITENLKMK